MNANDERASLALLTEQQECIRALQARVSELEGALRALTSVYPRAEMRWGDVYETPEFEAALAEARGVLERPAKEAEYARANEALRRMWEAADRAIAAEQAGRVNYE